MSQTKAQLLDPKGDVTYSGHITGVGATFSGNLDVTGNVSVGGTLTKQDVTNVDSVGVITARSGIKVTAGGIDCTGITSITGADDTDNFVIDVSGGSQFVVHTDSSDGEISLRAQDGSGNNYSKYMSFFTQPSGAVVAPRLTITSGGGLKYHNADSPTNANSQSQILNHTGGFQFYGSSDSGTHRNIIFGTNNASAGERLRITSQGSVGINSTSPVGTLDVTTTAGAGSTVFIYAANHDASATSQAELRFGFAHSGSPEGIGYIKLKENGTNVFDGNLVFGVPNNNGSGGSLTNDVLTIKGSNQNVGIGTNSPVATDSNYNAGALHIHQTGGGGSQIHLTNNATGVAAGNGGAISMWSDDDLYINNQESDGQLKFGTAGTTRFTINSTGTATFTGAVLDYKGNVRSVPLNTQSSTYTLIATDAGKCILASNTVTFNTGIFGSGDVVTIINNTNGDITITQGSGAALYNTADGTTGSRTLATRGISTIYFTHNTTGYISGTGLS